MAVMASRLWFWAAVVRPLKHVVPLGMLVRLLHRSPRAPLNPKAVQEMESLLRRTGRVPRRPPANCLERSLGAYRVLCAAGAAPQVVVGIRRGTGTRVDGHVWVVVDGRPFGEDEAFISAFSRVLAYGPDGHQMPGSAPDVPDGVRLT
jgi:hypothetical protein